MVIISLPFRFSNFPFRKKKCSLIIELIKVNKHANLVVIYWFPN